LPRGKIPQRVLNKPLTQVSSEFAAYAAIFSELFYRVVSKTLANPST
jgi:hypothetical protein